MGLKNWLLKLANRKNYSSGSYLLVKDEHGEIRVAKGTIRDLIRIKAKGFLSIKILRIRVDFVEEQINLNLMGKVLSETNIIYEVEELKREIKKYIEEFTGIRVNIIEIDFLQEDSIKKH